MYDGVVRIKTKLDTKSFEKQISEVEDELKIIEDMIEKPKDYKLSGDDLFNLNVEAEKLNNKLVDLRKKQIDLLDADSSNITDLLNDSSEKISDIIKKVSVWALGIFGVRTAYNMLQNSISTISQYNEQISTDIEYIRFAIASTLQPVIERMLKLVIQLLTYVNYLSKAWFGINLFANGSADAFNNARKSTSKMNKDTKQIAKNLASGIDEITSLSEDTSTANIGGVDTSISAPSFDLSNMENIKIPEWLEWIANNGDLIIKILEGIAAAIISIKYGFDLIQGLGIFLIIDSVLDGIKDIKKFLEDPTWENFSKVLIDISKGLAGLALFFSKSDKYSKFSKPLAEISLALAGIAVIIKGVIDYLEDPTWENFLTILGGIAIAAIAIGLAFGSTAGIIALVIGAIAAIGLAIYKNWDEISEFLLGIWTWIDENVIQPIVDSFDSAIDDIASILGLLVSIFDGIFTTIGEIISEPFINLWDTVTDTELYDNIVGFFSNIGSAIKKLFLGDIKEALKDFKSAFDNVFGALWSIVKSPLNLIIGGFNALIKGINKIKLDVPDWVPQIGGKTLGFNIKTIPKLERGGIVNNPGGGVNMGNYIAGEKGAEAILPLQNSRFVQEFANLVASNMNFDIVIDLLFEIARILNEKNNSSTILNINGKEFAQATYQDYKNEENRQLNSTIIRRV